MFATYPHMDRTRSPNLTSVPAEDAPRAGVLIVEDERVARRALAAILSASGYETAAAESAEEALRLLQDLENRADAHAHPRIALVDFNLPGMNGVDFIARLERLEPGVFPVLMTAASEEVVTEAVKDRNLIYLRKPLDLAELMTIITHGEERH